MLNKHRRTKGRNQTNYTKFFWKKCWHTKNLKYNGRKNKLQEGKTEIQRDRQEQQKKNKGHKK